MSGSFENLEVMMFYIMIFTYLASTVMYWSWLASRKDVLGKLGSLFAAVGVVANIVALAVRWVVTGRPPLTNGYEFILTFSLGIVGVLLFSEFKYKLKALGAFVMPVPFLLLAFIILKMGPAERVAAAIPPALKSQWLTFHVFTAMLAYGAFAVSFGLGIMYLLKADSGSAAGKNSKGSWVSKFPDENTLDELAYKIIGFAFPMLTLCIVTGAIWANYAWGTYWSWDPKETWSLITWIIYAAYLHARLMYGWKGKRAAWMAILGFVAVLFTFFGVNYLLPGLHSYA